METKRFEITLYPYQELSDEGKLKAKKWYASLKNKNWSNVDSELITEQIQKFLQEMGYPTDNIQWRLSYSQGDGVAFYGKIDNENLSILAKRLITNDEIASIDIPNDSEELSISEKQDLFLEYLLDYVDITIASNNPHYSHARTMQINVESCAEYEEDIRFQALLKRFLDLIKEEIIQVSQHLEKKGYEEIEYQLSEESLISDAEVNEWRFDCNGTIFNPPSTAVEIQD